MSLRTGQESVRLFNLQFPIGTKCVFRGEKHKTWSHAGLGPKWEPVAFLDNGNDQEPVPIRLLEIDGFEMIIGKQGKAATK